ncbi:GYF domain-containing protein [Flavobacterium faecale]|uniref:GYF domain-containing protein n=1 Tax=Flavobacterium faecale TaxID=1355330 RepID=UPI003AAD4818
MNSYFLHNGTESSGPFTIEELKTKNIKGNTPVWCQGMPDWTTAAEVEELKSLLMVIPPPIKNNPTVVKETPNPTVVKETFKTKKNKRILGLNKSVFYFVSFFGILIIASFFLSLYQDNRREALELKNRETEKNNIQYRLQQKEIEEQKIQLAIQEKIEADRLLKEKKETIQNKLFSNQELLIVANTNFEEAKKQLAEASNFQFFRSAAEREEEVYDAQKQISYWKKEIEKIENENYQLKLELERIH